MVSIRAITLLNHRIREIMVKAYENALYEENVALARSERIRLFSQIVQTVMEDMLKKPVDESTPKKGFQ